MNKVSQELISKLELHPKLLERMEKLLLIVDGEGTDEIKLADDAEEAVIANLREFGQELIEAWGTGQVRRVNTNFKASMPEIESHSKKNCIGTQVTEKLK